MKTRISQGKLQAIKAVTNIPNGFTVHDAIDTAKYVLDHKASDTAPDNIINFYAKFTHYDCFSSFGGWALAVKAILES